MLWKGRARHRSYPEVCSDSQAGGGGGENLISLGRDEIPTQRVTVRTGKHRQTASLYRLWNTASAPGRLVSWFSPS